MAYQNFFKEADSNIKSAIGFGTASIYKGPYRSSQNVFHKEDEIYVAKDLEDAIKHSESKPTVLVVKGPREVLWAKPVVKGELVNGMFGGSFIYSSNDVVMKGYSHPIRLMDRVEH